jgi:hypothetical protein
VSFWLSKAREKEVAHHVNLRGAIMIRQCVLLRSNSACARGARRKIFAWPIRTIDFVRAVWLQCERETWIRRARKIEPEIGVMWQDRRFG